ncbi:UBN2_3 domain-containing protein [Gossypium australe]|uniref:UBN2_3 domain-containing protein n=1 Tax=Gossypium australe TaxID=47621 RepID=A0A5B6U9S7_9ROSI|nr:UBN2_3 domain-containing protein [Gossypium australe]
MAVPPPSSLAIDFHHPLYLHPSNIPSTFLVSHKLLGFENYTVWSRSMRIALLANNKLEFVDGTSLQVDLPANLYPQWDCCNAIFLYWILNTVCQELSSGIVFASNACLVWKDL